MLCPRERLDKGHYLFFFFPVWSQQPGMQWPCFQMALVIHLLSAAQVSCHSAGSELLEAAVPRPLAAALPWPRPSRAVVEMSFCLGNILLFGLTLKRKFLPLSPDFLLCWLLPPPSIPGGYFGISVSVNSYMTWQSFQGCQPLSCQCFKDGQPLQTAGVCTPVSSFPHSMQAQCVCLAPGLAASTYALWPGPNIAGFWGQSWEN